MHLERRLTMSEPRRPDVAILRDVREELTCDARVEGAPVTATVLDGIVTLKGTARSWTTRLAAVEAARRIRGVRDVVSHIVVTPKVAHIRSDKQVGQAVRHALAGDLTGARELRNRIVEGAHKQPPSAREVRARIAQALARHIAHAAKHVQIEVENGKVTLRGEVPSWTERLVIEGAVRGTSGVSVVESRLSIR
jgi:osmotically-inducible protein OsmY